MESNQQGAPSVVPEKTEAHWVQRLDRPSDLLIKAVNIYREKFVKIVSLYGLAILAFLPLAVVALLFWALIKFGTGMDGTVRVVLQIIFSLSALAALVVGIWYNIAVQVAVYLIPEIANEEGVRALLKRGRAMAGKYFGISILVALFTFLWLLLLIVPGIIMSVSYSLAGLCFIYEGYQSTAAIKRSKELTKGYWWSLAGRYLFLSVIIWLIMLGLSIPTWFVEKNSAFLQVWNGITQIVSYLIAPVGMIYSYLIFRNLQRIKGEKKA